MGSIAPRLGIFLVPTADEAQNIVRQTTLADEVGLDLIGIQDHPYQRRYLDTWTLLSYLAACTERITLLPDVINLPLRQPAVLAKSVASLDLLSGGRVELGIGAGAFWDAVEAMGGRRRSPGESVDALEEAMRIIKAFLAGEHSLRFEGEHYRVKGARPGPEPAHPVGLWVGAYGPRMLRLTGRLGDGWLPSIGEHYMDPADVPANQQRIDEAARKAGRAPAEILRAVNVGLEDPEAWLDPERLAKTVEDLGFEVLLLGLPEKEPLEFIRCLGEDVAPRLRELTG